MSSVIAATNSGEKYSEYPAGPLERYLWNHSGCCSRYFPESSSINVAFLPSDWAIDSWVCHSGGGGSSIFSFILLTSSGEKCSKTLVCGERNCRNHSGWDARYCSALRCTAPLESDDSSARADVYIQPSGASSNRAISAVTNAIKSGERYSKIFPFLCRRVLNHSGWGSRY